MNFFEDGTLGGLGAPQRFTMVESFDQLLRACGSSMLKPCTSELDTLVRPKLTNGYLQVAIATNDG